MEKTNDLKQKKYAAIVITVCAALCILLLAGMSSAKYTSKVEGTAEMEPALFNTVLLGDLPYLFMTDEDGQDTTTPAESDGKLSRTIDVTKQMQFGAVDGKDASDMSSEKRKLRPGSVITIPFTVTNGVILESETTESNVAETDIAYAVNLITTTNIPLGYDVIRYASQAQYEKLMALGEDSYNYEQYLNAKEDAQNTSTDEEAMTSAAWGQILRKTTLERQYVPQVGRCDTHIIRDPESPDSEDPTFFLESDEDEITVDRYMLVVYWPDESDDLRDAKYMKEIDIIEVRLEIESWVVNNTLDTPVISEATTALMRLQTDKMKEETYYKLPSEAYSVYSRGTVPFYATRPYTDKDGKEVENTSYLNMRVTNEAVGTTYAWNEKEKTYEPRALAEGTDLKVAIAVPTSVMGAVNSYADENVFEYSVLYDGKNYKGTLTDDYIFTDVWKETVDGLDGAGNATTDSYTSYTEKAYRIVEFNYTPEEGELDPAGPLQLGNFTTAEKSEEELTLLIKSKSKVSYDNKDDFKILVYKKGTVNAE